MENSGIFELMNTGYDNNPYSGFNQACGCSNNCSGYGNCSGCSKCKRQSNFSNGSGTGTGQTFQQLTNVLQNLAGTEGIKMDFAVTLYPQEYLKLALTIIGSMGIGILLGTVLKKAIGAS